VSAGNKNQDGKPTEKFQLSILMLVQNYFFFFAAFFFLAAMSLSPPICFFGWFG